MEASTWISAVQLWTWSLCEPFGANECIIWYSFSHFVYTHYSHRYCFCYHPLSAKSFYCLCYLFYLSPPTQNKILSYLILSYLIFPELCDIYNIYRYIFSNIICDTMGPAISEAQNYMMWQIRFIKLCTVVSVF